MSGTVTSTSSPFRGASCAAWRTTRAEIRPAPTQFHELPTHSAASTAAKVTSTHVGRFGSTAGSNSASPTDGRKMSRSPFALLRSTAMFSDGTALIANHARPTIATVSKRPRSPQIRHASRPSTSAGKASSTG